MKLMTLIVSYKESGENQKNQRRKPEKTKSRKGPKVAHYRAE